MVEAVQAVLGKYAVFSGRSRRSEYWFWALATSLVSLLLTILDLVFHNSLLGLIFSLAVLLPGLTVSVRRLHDTGRSGWWLLIGLIPLVGAILLIVWMASDSQPGDNSYGPSPKGNPYMGQGQAPAA